MCSGMDSSKGERETLDQQGPEMIVIKGSGGFWECGVQLVICASSGLSTSMSRNMRCSANIALPRGYPAPSSQLGDGAGNLQQRDELVYNRMPP